MKSSSGRVDGLLKMPNTSSVQASLSTAALDGTADSCSSGWAAVSWNKTLFRGNGTGLRLGVYMLRVGEETERSALGVVGVVQLA